MYNGPVLLSIYDVEPPPETEWYSCKSPLSPNCIFLLSGRFTVLLNVETPDTFNCCVWVVPTTEIPIPVVLSRSEPL